MDLSRAFINNSGRLRSGWRFALFAVLYFFLQFIIYAVSFPILSFIRQQLGLPGHSGTLAFHVALLAAALLAGFICTRLLEGLPWRALGLSPHRNWIIHFLWGSLIGAGSLVLAVAIATASGGLLFSFSGDDLLPSIFQSLVTSGALFILAALAEEALFRGYPLQTFCRAKLSWVGLVLTSVAFSAVHLDNPNVVQGLTFLNTALAGVWFAVAYLRTRSLWFAWGLHWAWNWMLDSVLGLPVSGMNISAHPLFKSADLGPAWLTGGRYGIEGGVAATLALIIATLFVWRSRAISPDTEMLLLTSQENPTSRTVRAISNEADEALSLEDIRIEN
jgi:hypothetical protein